VVQNLERLADLIRQRNALEIEITKITGRPAGIGSIGEYLGAQIFRVELAPSATHKGSDGRFQGGPLHGAAVEIKCYPKREGLLDMKIVEPVPDYYLVLTGPKGTAISSRGQPRPWCIAAVYLFNARELAAAQRARGVAIGIASSIPNALWDAAEIYPKPQNPALTLSDDQRHLLELFA